MSKLLTTIEVASELGVELQLVYRLISRGSLKAIKIGDLPRSHWRIRRSDLQKFLDERQRGN